MQIADITKKMIAYSEGNTHDINHFLKVWSFARTIGQLEGLDGRTQEILEAAALLHDIACPLCREKYGNTNGKYQEKEGMPLAEAFLKDCGLSPEDNARIVYLVGHHHTLEDIRGMDYMRMKAIIPLRTSGISGSRYSGRKPGRRFWIRSTRGDTQEIFAERAARQCPSDRRRCVCCCN